jgi:hypothetical protein
MCVHPIVEGWKPESQYPEQGNAGLLGLVKSCEIVWFPRTIQKQGEKPRVKIQVIRPSRQVSLVSVTIAKSETGEKQKSL